MPNVAVLCPGPSLKAFWSDAAFDGYDLVIAVNTAAWLFRCHWMASVDPKIVDPMLSGETPRPLEGLLSNTHRNRQAKERGMQTAEPNLYFGRGTNQSMMKALGQPAADRCGYTFPNALEFGLRAAGSGPVHVFGFDASPSKTDVAGYEGDHGATRWMREGCWLKTIWNRRIRVHGLVPPFLLAWLRGPLTPFPIDTMLEHLYGREGAIAMRQRMQDKLAAKDRKLGRSLVPCPHRRQVRTA